MSAETSIARSLAAPAQRRAVAWYAFAALCGAGVVTGTISMILPQPEGPDTAALWRNIALAAVTGLVTLALARRAAPIRWTHPFLVGGTYLVSNAIYQSGDGASAYAVWYVWVALFAFSFHERRSALLHLAGVAMAYGGVLALLPTEDGLGRWVTTVSTLAIAAAFVDALVRRMRQHAASVELLMGQLADEARTDELTGLPNRRSWSAALAAETARARRFGTPLWVAVFDLDGFKQLNDRLGHHAGDDLLRRAAEAWSEVVRDVDTLARWGGDEFGLLVSGCDEAEATEIAERVRTASPDGTTCSAGLVRWDGVEDHTRLLRRADDALYRAKHAGRDRLIIQPVASARP